MIYINFHLQFTCYKFFFCETGFNSAAVAAAARWQLLKCYFLLSLIENVRDDDVQLTLLQITRDYAVSHPRHLPLLRLWWFYFTTAFSSL